MASKSSFFLAILLIANPIMLLFFQNCTPLPKEGSSNSKYDFTRESLKKEISYRVDKNLIIK